MVFLRTNYTGQGAAGQYEPRLESEVSSFECHYGDILCVAFVWFDTRYAQWMLLNLPESCD